MEQDRAPDAVRLLHEPAPGQGEREQDDQERESDWLKLLEKREVVTSIYQILTQTASLFSEMWEHSG